MTIDIEAYQHGTRADCSQAEILYDLSHLRGRARLRADPPGPTEGTQAPWKRTERGCSRERSALVVVTESAEHAAASTRHSCEQVAAVGQGTGQNVDMPMHDLEYPRDYTYRRVKIRFSKQSYHRSQTQSGRPIDSVSRATGGVPCRYGFRLLMETSHKTDRRDRQQNVTEQANITPVGGCRVVLSRDQGCLYAQIPNQPEIQRFSASSGRELSLHAPLRYL